MPTSLTCSLLPYMEEYYDSGKNPPCWLPAIMVATTAGLRSDLVNTDCHGLRHSVGPRGRTVTVEHDQASVENLLVGGSTGFGVGATSDAGTLASQLAVATGESWANFCVRAHTLQQQLTQFTFHAAQFRSLRRIVLFCGLNEIEAFHRCVLMPRTYGPFFSWNGYFQAMNSHMVDPNTRAYMGPEGGHLIRIEDHTTDWQSYASVLDATFGTWSMLARALGASLHYYLQPLPGFMTRCGSDEERRIQGHMARIAPETFEVRTRKNFDAYRLWYRDTLQRSCLRYDIPFTDLNQVLDDDTHSGEWLFVDTSHLTDRGHEICAEAVLDGLR